MILAGLLLWGAVSTLWALDPARSLVLDLRLAALFLTGLALVMAADRIAAPWRIALCLFAGSAIGIALAAYDLLSAGGLTQFVSIRGFRPARLDQIAIGLAILLLPVSAKLPAPMSATKIRSTGAKPRSRPNARCSSVRIARP